MKISLIHKYFSELEVSGQKVPSSMSPKLGAFIHQEILRQFKELPIEVNMMVGISNYINQFNLFLEERGITVLDVEIPIEVKTWEIYLNGNIDILASDKFGNIGVIELKCGNSIDSHKYQVATYAQGLKEMWGFPIKFGTLLYLRENHFIEVTWYNKILQSLIEETKEIVNNNIGGLLIFEKENGNRTFR